MILSVFRSVGYVFFSLVLRIIFILLTIIITCFFLRFTIFRAYQMAHHTLICELIFFSDNISLYAYFFLIISVCSLLEL